MRTLLGIFIVLLSVLGVQRGEAQGRPPDVPPHRSLTATSQRDLAFGEVLRGISTTVPSTDSRRSGRFQISGPRNATIGLDMILPLAMTSVEGHEMPLAFGPGDGLATDNLGQVGGLTFNPWEPLTVVLGAAGRLYVRLGGTALPTSTQPPGTYSATISLTVYSLGT